MYPVCKGGLFIPQEAMAFHDRRPIASTWSVLGFPPSQREEVPVIGKPGHPCGQPPTRPTAASLSQMHSIRNLPSTRSREQRREDGVEDMTQLE